MRNKRNKKYMPGERLSVYLNKDLPDHFFEWLYKQDDISALVLFGLENLYKEYGNENLGGILPRRFNFELDQVIIKRDQSIVQVQNVSEAIIKQPEFVQETPALVSVEPISVDKKIEASSPKVKEKDEVTVHPKNNDIKVNEIDKSSPWSKLPDVDDF